MNRGGFVKDFYLGCNSSERGQDHKCRLWLLHLAGEPHQQQHPARCGDERKRQSFGGTRRGWSPSIATISAAKTRLALNRTRARLPAIVAQGSVAFDYGRAPHAPTVPAIATLARRRQRARHCEYTRTRLCVERSRHRTEEHQDRGNGVQQHRHRYAVDVPDVRYCQPAPCIVQKL